MTNILFDKTTYFLQFAFDQSLLQSTKTMWLPMCGQTQQRQWVLGSDQGMFLDFSCFEFCTPQSDGHGYFRKIIYFCSGSEKLICFQINSYEYYIHHIQRFVCKEIENIFNVLTEIFSFLKF